MDKYKKYIPFCIAILLIFLIDGISFWRSRHGISAIPATAVGNSAGNLRGGGLFCEYNGKVYFSNPYDNDALYVMNPDCTDMKRLIPSAVSYINAGGDYLFYYMQSVKGGTGLGFVRATTGIFRSSLNGKHIESLDNHMATMMLLIGDTVYFQHYDNDNFSTFNKVPADASKKEIVLSKDIIETACADNGILYYAGLTNDHYLYAWDTRTDTERVLWEGNIAYPTVIGNYVYYMDIDNDYRLFRCNMANGEIIPLTEERIDFYNIYGNVIFYQTDVNPTPALMRMNIDGSGAEVVAEGIYNHINTTSAYTYFLPYETGEEPVIYRTPTFGPVAVDTFPEALNITLKD